MTETISKEPNIELARASGDPEGRHRCDRQWSLTSPPLSQSIKDFCLFYDAISPIVDAETIDQSKVYRASRYGNLDDYVNLSDGSGSI